MCFEQYTIVRHWSCLSLLPCSAQNVQVATSTIRKVAGSHLVVRGGNSWINATIIREFPPQPQLPRKFRIWRQIWEPQNWKPKDNLDSYMYISYKKQKYIDFLSLDSQRIWMRSTRGKNVKSTFDPLPDADVVVRGKSIWRRWLLWQAWRVNNILLRLF